MERQRIRLADRVTRRSTTPPLPCRPVSDVRLPDDLRLRPVRRADRPFLLTLYGSVRAPELRGCAWPESRKQAFIADQFRLQQAHYLAAYPAADYWVIDRGPATEPIGRLSLDRSRRAWHVIELSLLPEERGNGRGSAMIRWVQGMAEAEAAESVALYVASENVGALRLYTRSGFGRLPSRFPTHAFLRWAPPRASGMV